MQLSTKFEEFDIFRAHSGRAIANTNQSDKRELKVVTPLPDECFCQGYDIIVHKPSIICAECNSHALNSAIMQGVAV